MALALAPLVKRAQEGRVAFDERVLAVSWVFLSLADLFFFLRAICSHVVYVIPAWPAHVRPRTERRAYEDAGQDAGTDGRHDRLRDPGGDRLVRCENMGG